MVELNEDCLSHLFGFLTPLEWIQVSDVCQLWRQAALRHWKKITEINYLDSKYKPRINRKVPVITPEDGRKMLLHAAEFIETVRATCNCSQRDQDVLFGKYLYTVDFFDLKNTLKLLAKHATEITELEFDETPDVRLLKPLLETNKIKKFKVKKCSEFYRYVQTDTIEELDVYFENLDFRFAPYKGHFPNLQKLTMKMEYEHYCQPEVVFSKIFPYVLGIKSLNLTMSFYPDRTKSHKFFHDITRLSQLEELVLSIDDLYVKNAEFLFKNLGLGCPKLRLLAIDGFDVDEKLIQTCLTFFPNLERLEAVVTELGQIKEIPEMPKMKTLFFKMRGEIESFPNFTNTIVKKLPNLETLYLSTNEDQIELVLSIVTVATSQNKDVILSGFSKKSNKLKILKKIVGTDEKRQTLDVIITNSFFDEVKAFVQSKLECYNAVVVDCKDKAVENA